MIFKYISANVFKIRFFAHKNQIKINLTKPICLAFLITKNIYIIRSNRFLLICVRNLIHNDIMTLIFLRLRKTLNFVSMKKYLKLTYKNLDTSHFFLKLNNVSWKNNGTRESLKPIKNEYLRPLAVHTYRNI